MSDLDRARTLLLTQLDVRARYLLVMELLDFDDPYEPCDFDEGEP